MAFLIAIAVFSLAVWLIVRAEPNEDRAGDREMRWYGPETLFDRTDQPKCTCKPSGTAQQSG